MRFRLEISKNWYIKSGDSIEEDQVEQISVIPEEFLPKSGEFLDLKNARIRTYQKRIEQEIAALPKFPESFDFYYTDIATQTFYLLLITSRFCKISLFLLRKVPYQKNIIHILLILKPQGKKFYANRRSKNYETNNGF